MSISNFDWGLRGSLAIARSPKSLRSRLMLGTAIPSCWVLRTIHATLNVPRALEYFINKRYHKALQIRMGYSKSDLADHFRVSVENYDIIPRDTCLVTLLTTCFQMPASWDLHATIKIHLYNATCVTPRRYRKKQVHYIRSLYPFSSCLGDEISPSI